MSTVENTRHEQLKSIFYFNIYLFIFPNYSGLPVISHFLCIPVTEIGNSGEIRRNSGEILGPDPVRLYNFQDTARLRKVLSISASTRCTETIETAIFSVFTACTRQQMSFTLNFAYSSPALSFSFSLSLLSTFVNIFNEYMNL